jgi:hypothetical protein
VEELAWTRNYDELTLHIRFQRTNLSLETNKIIMELQAPSLLAQLPRPLEASSGKIHVGEVYGFAASKKRRRYEIAVAIDGEAVSIYDVSDFPVKSSKHPSSDSKFASGTITETRRILCNSSSVVLLLSPMLCSS